MILRSAVAGAGVLIVALGLWVALFAALTRHEWVTAGLAVWAGAATAYVLVHDER